MRKPYQVVLDTNVLVSAIRLSDGASFKLLSLLQKGFFQHHLSVPLGFEYEEVLHRHAKFLSIDPETIEAILDYTIGTAIPHELFFLWRPCLVDPGDEMVLELAVTANCEYIITHNIRHFSAIKSFSFRAITPRDFLLKIGA